MNFAAPAAPGLANPADESFTATVKLPAHRTRDVAAAPVDAAAVLTSDAHDLEESGCVCRNCSGKGDCGRER